MRICNIAFIVYVCSIIVGCGACNSDTDKNSCHGLHYSELINKLGEPKQVFGDGSGGKTLSWSTIPIDDDIENESHKGLLPHDVYRLNFKGEVYSLP